MRKSVDKLKFFLPFIPLGANGGGWAQTLHLVIMRRVLYHCACDLLTSARPGWESLPGAWRLACLASPSVTKKKTFIILTPGVNGIKLFSFVTDDGIIS